MKTTYTIFWELLPAALMIADIKSGQTQFLSAVKRLRTIEGELTGPGTGQTGYLNNVDPYQAAADYVAHTYNHAPAPFWLISAERG